MPIFVPFTRTTPLPQIGTPESLVLDFKQLPSCKERGLPAREPSSWSHAEAAKDMAAFANAIGGTLLIGAEGEPRLRGWVSLDAHVSALVVAHYNDALTRHVRPKPLTTFEVLERDESNRVVAVNVWPFAGQAVGARTIADSYTFAVRVNDQNVPYSPEQLPMLMIPELRRVATLLHQIPPGAPVRVYRDVPPLLDARGQPSHLAGRPAPVIYTLQSFDEDQNFVYLQTTRHTPLWEDTWYMPLDDVEAVWNKPGDAPSWNIRIRTVR